MFIRRTVIAAALVAVPLAFAAPALAEAAPCSYFGAGESNSESQGICGVPDLAGTFGQVRTNLTTNFNLGTAAGNLRDNFNPGTAAGNLEHAITHGVGEQDKNAP
jgi:hypothetical protein